jgi:hypothetical protein
MAANLVLAGLRRELPLLLGLGALAIRFLDPVDRGLAHRVGADALDLVGTFPFGQLFLGLLAFGLLGLLAFGLLDALAVGFRSFAVGLWRVRDFCRTRLLN